MNRERLISLAARESVPVMYEWPEFVGEGGLISYGTDPADIWRQAGIYAARILTGEKAGDLPVVEPDKYRSSLTSRPRKRWVSPYLLDSSPAQTRSLSNGNRLFRCISPEVGRKRATPPRTGPARRT